MIGTILIFIAVLFVIVIAHEAGHFFVARFHRIHVEEFGFGFPPKIFGKMKGKTLFSINALPLGGFVKLKGEQGDHKKDADSFSHAPIWRRATVLAAGVTMNVLLAIFLYSIAFSFGFPTAIDSNLSPHAQVRDVRLQIVGVEQGTPAEKSGLKSNDIIRSINSTTVATSQELQHITKSNEGKTVSLMIERSHKTLQVFVTPTKLSGSNNQIGVGIFTSRVGTVSYSMPYAVWMGIVETVKVLWLIISSLWNLLVTLITHQTVSGDVVGPVGIAVITGKVLNLGFTYLLQLVAIISLNLAIINIIPIPALDGGRIFFLCIEKLRGRPINQRVEALLHNVGFVALLLLIMIITVRDLFHLDMIKRLF